MPGLQDANSSLQPFPYPTKSKSLVGAVSLNDCINLLRHKDQLFSQCITDIVFAHSTKSHCMSLHNAFVRSYQMWDEQPNKPRERPAIIKSIRCYM